MQLALLALTVARTAGNSELELSDFLFDEKAEKPKLTAAQGAFALDTIAGGIGVRKLGQGRKVKTDG